MEDLRVPYGCDNNVVRDILDFVSFRSICYVNGVDVFAGDVHMSLRRCLCCRLFLCSLA